MLISYNADLLPKVRMLGQIRYNEPWLHFSRCINEWVLYVIRDGNLYLQEDGVRYHLSAGDFFLLEPGLPHEGYQKAVCDYYYAHFTHPHAVVVIPFTVLTVLALLLVVGYNHTAYYPSTADLQSSLTIANSCSSQFTLKTMAYVSILVPFVLAYIIYAWRAIDRKPLTMEEIKEDEHSY